MDRSEQTRQYYDDFSHRVLVRDFQYLNLRHEAIKALCRRHIRDGAQVLDIGCGVGIIARYLQGFAARVVAVDISEENVRIAREYAGSDRCDVRVLDVIDQSAELAAMGPFDAAVLPDVMEHIPKDRYRDLFAALEGVLTQDARVIITYPSPEMQVYMAEEEPEGMQLLEEQIEIEDILGATSLKPLYFGYQSIWGENDYVHFVLTPRRDCKPNSVRRSFLETLVNRIKKYRWRFSNRGFTRKLAAMAPRSRPE